MTYFIIHFISTHADIWLNFSFKFFFTFVCDLWKPTCITAACLSAVVKKKLKKCSSEILFDRGEYLKP